MAVIPLCTLIPHGKITTVAEADTLILTSQGSDTSIAYNLTGDSYKRHYAGLPLKAHIPFVLSVELKLDYTGLLLLVGDGHIAFRCPGNHAIADPMKPTGKPLRFGNYIPAGAFVSITVTYGINEMQILINGQEAFYSAKMPYMKVLTLAGADPDGLNIGFSVAKLSELCIRKIELSEAPINAPVSRPEPYNLQSPIADIKGPVNFYSFVSRFPETIRNEITATDECLMSLKLLRIKRIADKSGKKLTYVSEKSGFSYSIRCMDGVAWQSFGFYIVTSGKPEAWHRRADYMEEVLTYISKTDSRLADRIFNALNDCVGCYGAKCIVKTPYSFNGQRRLACHGVVTLRICPADFGDVRDFFRYLNMLLEQKYAEGTLTTEKIFLINR